MFSVNNRVTNCHLNYRAIGFLLATECSCELTRIPIFPHYMLCFIEDQSLLYIFCPLASILKMTLIAGPIARPVSILAALVTLVYN